MSTITFSNGKSVNFNGTPTPEDIDYVAKQMGIQPNQPQTTTAPTAGSPFEQGVTSGIAKYNKIPVIGGLMAGMASAANKVYSALSIPQVGQDISQGLYLAFGGQKKIDSITKQYLDNASTLTQLAQKQTDPTLKAKYAKMAVDDIKEAKNAGGSIIGDTRTPEQIVGDFVGLGTDVLSAGTLPEAGAATEGYQTTAKIAPTMFESAMKGAEIGGKAGLAFGAGQGLSQGLQAKGNVGQVATSTVKGAAIGGGTGIVAGGVLGAGSSALADKTPAVQKAEEMSTIQDTISPKTTVKEARLAESQGRLVKGKPASFWKSQTADEILPSAKVQKATETIQREIPGASKMNEPQLYDALDKKTSEIAQNLKPEMQKTPVGGSVQSKMQSDWTTMKAQQVKDPYMSKNVNIKKLQADFAERLDNILTKTKNPTLDDLWQERINYDTSVPKPVKEATSLSGDDLMTKKNIWLQQRRILNNAINDASSGMGKTSQQAFSDMTDMYSSQQNILTKAKVQTTALQPSTIKKIGGGAGKEVLKYGGTALGIEGLIEGGKRLFTGKW
jgi:hypothetical protein